MCPALSGQSSHSHSPSRVVPAMGMHCTDLQWQGVHWSRFRMLCCEPIMLPRVSQAPPSQRPSAAEMPRQPVLGGMGLLWWLSLAWGLPDSLSQTYIHCGKVRDASTQASFPLCLTQGQTCIIIWWFSQPSPAPSYVLTGISSNQILAHSIPFWCLLLEEPELTHMPCSFLSQGFALCSCLNSHLQWMSCHIFFTYSGPTHLVDTAPITPPPWSLPCLPVLHGPWACPHPPRFTYFCRSCVVFCFKDGEHIFGFPTIWEQGVRQTLPH